MKNELKLIEDILEASINQTENYKTLKFWTEGLAELVINHIAKGDEEAKSLLYLQLEQNMLKSKKGKL